MPEQRTFACDLGACVNPDLGTVDALARIQLVARRYGFYVRLQDVSRDLEELLAFAGLADVLLVEPLGQAEEREQPIGVEEEGELADPSC
jgi:hypothetical protein